MWVRSRRGVVDCSRTRDLRHRLEATSRPVGARGLSPEFVSIDTTMLAGVSSALSGRGVRPGSGALRKQCALGRVDVIRRGFCLKSQRLSREFECDHRRVGGRIARGRSTVPNRLLLRASRAAARFREDLFCALVEIDSCGGVTLRAGHHRDQLRAIDSEQAPGAMPTQKRSLHPVANRRDVHARDLRGLLRRHVHRSAAWGGLVDGLRAEAVRAELIAHDVANRVTDDCAERVLECAAHRAPLHSRARASTLLREAPAMSIYHGCPSSPTASSTPRP